MQCYLYVMSGDSGEADRCKIGISKNPEKRLQQIQTTSPFQVHLRGAFRFTSIDAARQAEAHLHLVFEDDREWGEWFTLDYVIALETLDSYIDALVVEHMAHLGFTIPYTDDQRSIVTAITSKIMTERRI